MRNEITHMMNETNNTLINSNSNENIFYNLYFVPILSTIIPFAIVIFCFIISMLL